MIIPATYNTAAEMRSAYVERYNRLRRVPATPRALPVPQPVIVEPPPPPPMWRTTWMNFSDHVVRWKRYLVDHDVPAVAYLKVRCVELDLSYDEIIGPSRFRPIVQARHLLIWEIKQKYPRISYPRLGRIFNRDHSSVWHACQKIEAERTAGI